MNSVKPIKRRMSWKAWPVLLGLVTLLAAVPFSAGAAGVNYAGRGSKSDPYLVQTVEQLDGMRNNLSAHYKLANTIDLSGVANFTPIGYLAKPFTGSFVCDLGKDNKPLYAIKNLKVSVKCQPNYADYKEKESRWEAALFGATNGASITNILVLDAKIENSVPGKSKMNSDYTVNPGQDEQAAAPLIGYATNTTVSGCGATGTVDSKSNYTAGLIASAVGGGVSNSYSYATVKTTGEWNTGGLIGHCDTNVSRSFYSGSVKGGAFCVGSLIGFMSSETYKVTDCYAEGTIESSAANSFIGVESRTSLVEIVQMASNCYTTSKIVGRTKAQSNKKVTNNNYITDEVGGLQTGFAAASREDINKVFATLSAWEVKGSGYPQLKGLYPVKSAAAYKPQKATQPPATNGSPAATTKPGGAVNTAPGGATQQPGQPGVTDPDATTPDGTTPTQQATEASGATIAATTAVAVGNGQTIEKTEPGTISTAELVLIIVLSVLILGTIAGSVVTLVQMKRSAKR